MHKLKMLTLSLLTGVAISCCDKQEPKTTENSLPSHAVEKKVTIDVSTFYQTIAGFGASDCWLPAWIGKYWTESRERLSELLFSSVIEGKNPKGIGLSMWRVNLGAGSAEQGNASGI